MYWLVILLMSIVLGVVTLNILPGVCDTGEFFGCI